MAKTRDLNTHIDSKDLAVLRYAGMMGHEFILIETLKGEAHVSGECNSREGCHRFAGIGDRIYQKDGKKFRLIEVVTKKTGGAK